MRAESQAEQAVRRCLAAIEDPAGEGRRVFTQVYAASALAEAQASDRRRAAGAPLSGLDGLIVAVKDLFDVRGEPTWAGSRVLRETPVAARDARAVERLRQAGAVIIGKTNMTEFAYSGLGLNPHFGTPANPFDRAHRRIPGGSSSGAAVAVTDGMASLGLGTDTGGSVRIPAAFCALTGWKPTARRISTAGVYPLAPSLDSVGVIAQSVEWCWQADRVLAEVPLAQAPIEPRQLRLGRLRGYVEQGLEPAVEAAYERALERLRALGVAVTDLVIPALERVPREQLNVTISAFEAFHVHAELLSQHAALYDPRVRMRLELGREIARTQYQAALEARAQLQREAAAALAGFDALLLPTVCRVAPTIESLSADADYVAINREVLRNTSLLNFLDGCAISLPCHRHGEAPVGLSIAQLALKDAQVLAIAAALESVIGRESAAPQAARQ